MPSTHNFVEEMLRSAANWSAINGTVTAIQEKLKELERARKARQMHGLVALV